MIFHLFIDQTKHLNLRLNTSYSAAEYSHYKGSYVVSPKVVPQTLETKDKVMDDDVGIKEIYINETENQSGGLTVQIGEI
jgi:hypothetical protein